VLDRAPCRAKARRSTNASSIRCGNAQLPRPSAIADELARASQATQPTPPFRPLDRDAKRLEKLVAKGVGVVASQAQSVGHAAGRATLDPTRGDHPNFGTETNLAVEAHEFCDEGFVLPERDARQPAYCEVGVARDGDAGR
jgi:hypothetical protein